MTNSPSDTVSVVDTKTRSVVHTVNVGGEPSGVAVSPDGSRAYVANRDSSNGSVIDTATNKVVATVTVGGSPDAVAIAALDTDGG